MDCGKKGVTTCQRRTPTVILMSFLIIVVLCAQNVLANPAGGQVAAGNASISRPTANTVQVNQTSDKAIINWHSFNIAPNEKTHFQQPTTSSITLNRINPSQGASQIFGQLSANGRIILVNQAGIYFGSTARVDVGGMIASTSDISDKNFMAGKYIFDQPSGYSGSVLNKGTIKAGSSGLVALLGTSVQNDGLIVAKVGTVALASGNKFTLDFIGDGLINFAVDEPATSLGVDQNGKSLKNSVSNSGKIIANGGQIIMRANAVRGVLRSSINMSGVLVANSVSQKNGVIILSAGDGRVRVSGKIHSTGKHYAQKGGTVKILGKNVILDKNASIDVSGNAGGGEILIGGNAHGAGPEINAQHTYVDHNVNLNADALVAGNGGKVVVWSDLGTQFYGNISALGGAKNGNGGWVETSGEYLDINGGKVNASAPHGIAGSWLLDPRNVVINTSTTTCTSLPCFSAGDPTIYTPDTNSSSVNVNDILTALEGGTSVTITTGNSGTQTGTIAVNTAINKTSGTTPVTLTLDSSDGGGTITISNPISASGSSGALNLTLNSGNAITVNGNITTNGGDFLSTSQTATNISASRTINTGSGSVTINANASAVGGQDFVMTATSQITTSGSPVTINVNGAGGGTGQATLGIISTSGGTLTVGTDTGGNTTGSSIVQAGTIGSASILTVGAANFSTGNGAITLTHTNNDFTGAVSLTSDTASNNLALTDINALQLGTVSMPNGLGTFTILTNGAITQSGSTIITSGTGLSSFNSGATGAPITLTNDNVFNGAVALSNVGANDVSIKNIGNLSLDTIGVGGNFDVTASNGRISQSTSAKVITVAGNASFTGTGAGDSITISNNNKFTGTVSLSNTGVNDVSIKNTLPLILGTVNVGNNLSAVTTGTGSAISQLGITTITVPGTSSFNAAANSISLGNNNSLTGAVTLTNSGANDVTLTNTSALQLDTSTIGGNLTLTAGGNISEIGVITASTGTTTLSTIASGSDILLGSEANNFGASALTFSGTLSNIRDVEIQNTNTLAATPDFSTMTNLRNLTLNFTGTNLTLGALTLHSGGNLSITAKGVTGGAISQTGPFIVPGTSSFTSTVGTSANRSITLADSGNQFTGNISVDNGGASASTSITNSLALKLATVSVGSGTLSFNGVGISEPGGAISQSSGTGAITLTANMGTIDLSNTSNNLLGVVSATNSAANSVTLVNSVALTLGNITLTGASNLSLTAPSVTQQAATTITSGTLAASTTNATNLSNNNSINNLSTVSAGGTFAFNTLSALNIIGNISANTTSSPLTITSSGLLTINNNVISSNGTNGISITGSGITQNASVINSGSGALTVNAGTGTLALNSGAQMLTTGNATVTADSMAFDSSAAPAQIGGTNTNTGLATRVVLQPGTLSRTIGIAGGAGNLSLSEVELNDIRSTNVRIGNASSSGNITINTWNPAANFANNGVLTLVTTGTILEGGAISLANNSAALLLRSASGVTLTNNNIFNNIAANISGLLSITNAATNPFTVTSFTDDIGTVTGITAPSGITLSASGTGGSITINQNLSTSNNIISLTGSGITQAANTTINAGTNNLTLNAGNGNLTMGASSLLYSRGIVTLTAGTMNLNGTQIGGSATATQTATNVIFTGSLGVSIGIAGGSGTLQLSGSALDTIKSVNVRIGDSTAGAVNIGTWTPASSSFVKNGVLTLDSASTISQTGAINLLSSSTRSLLIRDSSGVSLTDSGNVLNNLAANVSGNLSLTNASTNPLTVTSVTDDIGTVTGVTAPHGVTISTSGTGGLLTISGNITSTNSAISLAGSGITLSSNNTVDAGSGSLSVDAGSGTLTTNNNTQFYTTNIATLTADAMTLNTAATSKIGGNSSGTLAQNVILKPSTTGTSIGLSGGTGTLNLGSTELARVFAQNVQIGDSNSGAITISTWSPPVNFATSVLTLDTGSTVAQSGTLNLATSGSGLLLRDSTGVTLDNSNNIFTNVAANISGPITIVNKSTNPLTVSGLTDNVGTVNGITATGAINLTASGVGGSLTINQNITSGNNAITLSSVGITQTANTNVNAGSGTISIDASGGTMQFNTGTLNTTNNTASAIQIINGTTVALGNISANSGTITLGNGSISGAVTQNTGTTLAATILVANTTNSIDLNNSGNDFVSIGSITRGGALTINDMNALTVNGPITAGTISNAVLIQSGGVLTLNGNIATSGNNNINLVGTGFNNVAGGSALNPGSGRYLIWSGNPENDTRGGLAYNFKQYNATFGSSTAQGSGNGFLYSIAPTITVSLTGTVSKMYDATTATTLTGSNYITSGAIDGDTVTTSHPTNGTYDNKNVGTSKVVSVPGISITNATDGAATVYGYQLSSTTAEGNIGIITTAPLTVTAQTDTRVYNATTNSTVTPITSGTLYGTDSIGTSPIQTFDNKNVGTNKILTASGLIVNDGNNGNNYNVTYVANNTGVITAAPLTVTAQTDRRAYNGTTSSNVSPVIGGTIYGSDAVGTAPIQTFDNKNVGTNKILTASGLIMNDGNNGNNYNETYVDNNTGIITAASLTINNVSANNKIYDATTAATINTGSASLSGVFAGDTVNLNSSSATGAFDNKNVGSNKPVTTSGFTINGIDANNYAVIQPTTSATISPATLSIQGVIANNKIYDATTTATINTGSASLNGVFAGDTVNLNSSSATGIFNNKDAGINKPVTTSGFTINGIDANNYAVNQPTTSATINPATLTIQGVIANNKIYDGNNNATLNVINATLSGIFALDLGQVNAQNGTGLFSISTLGNNIPVTATSIPLNGFESENYVVSLPTGLTANILSPVPIELIPQILYPTINDLVLAPTFSFSPKLFPAINIVRQLEKLDRGLQNCADIGANITICTGS